jgi:hypothetical protein
MPSKEAPENKERLVESRDFYFEDGLMVLTAEYLLRRGYCCGNGCRHCPYDDLEEEDLKLARPAV